MAVARLFIFLGSFNRRYFGRSFLLTRVDESSQEVSNRCMADDGFKSVHPTKA